MRAIFLASLLGLALLAAGCRTREGTLIAVRVSATTTLPDVANLRVTATLQSDVRTINVPLTQKSIPPEQLFGIAVAGDRRGMITVQVEARSSQDAIVGTQSGSAELAPGMVVPLSIKLGGAAPMDLGSDLAPPDLTARDLAAAADLQPMCSAHFQCSAELPVCDNATGTCRACANNTDDSACISRGAAVCITNGPQTGRCGACQPMANHESASCPMGNNRHQVCDDSGTCAPCTMDAQCDSNVCDAGECAPTSEVARVSNSDACLNAAHDSTPPAMPYCEISAALQPGIRFILVKGSVTPYQHLIITDALPSSLVTIIGPGINATPPALLYQKQQIGVNVSFTQPGDQDGTLRIVGLVIAGTGGTELGDYGIKCTNTSPALVTIDVRSSRIAYQNQGGIFSTSCELQVSDSIISNVDNRGIIANGGTVSISRSIIRDNLSSGIAATSTGMLSLVNSIVAFNNTASSTSPAVVVSSGTARIINSTIANNRGMSSLYTGLNGGGSTCVMLNSVVDDLNGEDNLLGCDAHFSAWNGAPATSSNVDLSDCAATNIFADYAAGDFHLKQGTTFCTLVNLGGVSAAGLNAPATDLELNPRPTFGAFDIGAYERQ